MEKIGLILLSGILVDNFVLSKFLGICPFLGVSKKLDSSVGMGLAVTSVMVISTFATWPVYHFLLKPFGLEYLDTVVFILLIASLVQLLEITLKKYIPVLYKSLGVYLPLITTNCAVLGVTILNIEYEYGLLHAAINSFAGGVGFLIAMVLFSGVRARLENCVPPRSFEGIPITLIAASIVSLAFIGFGGMVS